MWVRNSPPSVPIHSGFEPSFLTSLYVYFHTGTGISSIWLLIVVRNLATFGFIADVHCIVS